MEQEHRPNQEGLQNRFSFEKNISFFDEDSRREIMFAYDIAKAAHRNQERDQGGRYFEHVRAVALILLTEVHTTDSDLVIAALLHDTPEDTAVFGNPYALHEFVLDGQIEVRQISYFEWIKNVYLNISKSFSPIVAEMVVGVTKPKPDGFKLLTHKSCEDLYHKVLKISSSKAKLLKMADRLHNLRTLSGTTQEKQLRKVKETEEVYFPIFESALKDYPIETEYLMREINMAIQKVGASKK